MAALQDALSSLAPTPWDSVPTDDAEPFLNSSFNSAQLLVDSIPISDPSSNSTPTGRSRANTALSIASSASEISESSARSTPPTSEVESLRKDWGKPIKINPRDNPLGISVYKLAGKDGNGAWFARRSVHEGLGFTKWKKALEAEFPETMKVQGGPGVGNVRGIGGERRVEYQTVEGLGRLEVYHLSAQFPGPTTPRDFVTLLLTSDQALSEGCAGTENGEIPRHFMVVSKPCLHPECPERVGYIRGQYQSVEFIREIPIKKIQKKSASTTNLTEKTRLRSNSSVLGREAVLRNATKATGDENANQQQSEAATSSESDLVGVSVRARGKTISFGQSRGHGAKGEHVDVPEEIDDEAETNPIEWIMVTRSDPGGSVPRFMVERGTPGGIISDASKFLDWACAKDISDFDAGIPGEIAADIDPNNNEQLLLRRSSKATLHDYQTNGHLAGLEAVSGPPETLDATAEQSAYTSGVIGSIAGVAGAAGGTIASLTPSFVQNYLPGHITMAVPQSTRRYSTSSDSSNSSLDSFASASEGDPAQFQYEKDNSSSISGDMVTGSASRIVSRQEKELSKLEEKKRKLDGKLAYERAKEVSKKSDDTEKEAAAIAKAEERHQRHIRRQEDKYRKEVEKLEKKRAKENWKSEEKRKKAVEKDEKLRIARELDDLKKEMELLRREKEILRGQVGDLQAENTALAAKVGRMGPVGEEVLRQVKSEVKLGGRLRASSLKGQWRSPAPSIISNYHGDTGKDSKENKS